MTKLYLDPRLIKRPPFVREMERPQWRVVSEQKDLVEREDIA
jgi:hypothetical protein